MKIRISHRTTYRYREPVSFGPHYVMLRPREGHDIHIESSILEITPAHNTRWIRDVNGNCIAKLDFLEPSNRLTIHSELLLHHYDTNPFDFLLDKNASTYPFVYPAESKSELAAFTQTLYPKDTAALSAWQQPFWRPGQSVGTMDLLQNLNLHIHRTLRYQQRNDEGVQTPAQTLNLQSGSCRDFATLFVEACRTWGLASRFVSGYMLCEATGAGGASTHAWAEVYLPGAGWKGFDPTSGIVTGSQHIAVAVSRDPEKAAPISGSFSGPANAFLGMDINVLVTEDGKAPTAGRS